MAATFGRKNAATASGQDDSTRRLAPSRPSQEADQARLGALYAQLSTAAPVEADRIAEPGLAVGARDEVDMMRAIGGNWEKYRDVWLKVRAGDSYPLSFSLAAALYSTPWLLYRKLYGYFFVVMAAQLALGYIIPNNGKYLSYAIGAFFGVYGKTLVVKRCAQLIDSINQMPISREDKARRIAKAGGVNLIGMLALLGAVALFILVVLALAASHVAKH